MLTSNTMRTICNTVGGQREKGKERERVGGRERGGRDRREIGRSGEGELKETREMNQRIKYQMHLSLNKLESNSESGEALNLSHNLLVL